MPSFAALAAAASLAFTSFAAARPIPHTVSLFRRAILDASDGILIVQNENAPKTYAASLEPYAQYHFRFMAIGCDHVDPHTTFFETCCQPRNTDKQDDASYPLACQLKTYLVFDPEYQKNQVVAKLGSISNYQDKLGYQDGDAPEVSVGDVESSKTSSSSSSWAESSSVQNTWTSSSESAWTPSSSSASAWTPSSSSSESWTPSSSSETWTPSSSWSSSSENTWTPPSSSASVWNAPAVQVKQVETSSSETWTPAPSQAWTPESSSQAPAPSTSAANNGGGDFTGTASWFTQNGNPGACGVYNSDSANIVAIKTDLYGWTGQKSQYCGRSLTITNTATGATAQAVVADACPGCSSYYSLDLSTGLFQQLGNLDQGLLPISWHWN